MIRLFKHYIPYAVVLMGLIDLVLLVMAAEIAWHVRAAQVEMSLGTLLGRTSLLMSFALVVLARHDLGRDLRH